MRRIIILFVVMAIASVNFLNEAKAISSDSDPLLAAGYSYPIYGMLDISNDSQYGDNVSRIHIKVTKDCIKLCYFKNVETEYSLDFYIISGPDRNSVNKIDTYSTQLDGEPVEVNVYDINGKIAINFDLNSCPVWLVYLLNTSKGLNNYFINVNTNNRRFL